MIIRNDGRTPTQFRETEIIPSFMHHAEGSVLIKSGNTHVICSASLELNVPRWIKGSGKGWITAEYSMLPRSSGDRIRRERNGSIKGRTQEIQRLIGRSLRAIVDMDKLGEKTIIVDCDVLRADGGTRTAAITGSFVALFQALYNMKNDHVIGELPIIDHVAAISVGLVNGAEYLDLDYVEDSSAEVDLNVVMTGSGEFVEIQGTGEKNTFTKKQLDNLIKMSQQGIHNLIEVQKLAIKTIKNMD